jgi:hypothetical protein
MNLFNLGVFQQILLAVIAASLLGSVVALLRGWASRREGLIWAGVCLAAGVVILWPEITSKVARALGIGRGADLVFYCAVVVMLLGFWMVYMRLRRMRREITVLVRHLAILEAEKDLADADRDRNASNTRDQPPPSAPRVENSE